MLHIVLVLDEFFMSGKITWMISSGLSWHDLTLVCIKGSEGSSGLLPILKVSCGVFEL